MTDPAINSPLVWADVPVADLERAKSFYEKVLDQKLERHTFPGGEILVVPHSEKQTSLCFHLDPSNPPSLQGPLLYLNVAGRLDDAIEQVKANGGSLLKEKESIGEYGSRAIIKDSEGNRIALHSEN